MTPLPPPPSSDPASEFLPLPIGHLFPNLAGDFSVYLRHGGSHTLFSRDGELLTARHRALLLQHGVDTVYIHREEHERYRQYIRRHLAGALLGEDLPLAEKGTAFYHNCCDIVRGLVRDRLPFGGSQRQGRLLTAHVRDCVTFLTTEAGLARVGRLMAHDYDVYSHGVHVFVYTVFLLQSLGLSRASIVQAGVGALLHDAGKEAVPLSILNKPGRLTPEEFLFIREHPRLGLRLCRSLSLSRLAMECIGLHHEKCNGQGYPWGRSGEAVPLHARVVALADVYDALTSNRVYAPAVSPFEALRIMRHEMEGSFDTDLYRRFVMLLSGADLA